MNEKRSIANGTHVCRDCLAQFGNFDGWKAHMDTHYLLREQSVHKPGLVAAPETVKDASPYAAKASKVRPSLFPVEGLNEAIKAMEYGAKKYGEHAWKEVKMDRSEFLDALERHLIAIKLGERADSESNVSHLGHIIANAAIILAKYGDK